MHKKLLEVAVENVRKRRDEGDCPVTPAYSVEWLEDMVIALSPEGEQISGEAVERGDHKFERIINSLNPEEAFDDTLLRDIHLRLQIHGEKYPDRMVSVLHRNVVLYTIAAAIQAAIGGRHD